jgi:hypothetical protein
MAVNLLSCEWYKHTWSYVNWWRQSTSSELKASVLPINVTSRRIITSLVIQPLPGIEVTAHFKHWYRCHTPICTYKAGPHFPLVPELFAIEGGNGRSISVCKYLSELRHCVEKEVRDISKRRNCCGNALGININELHLWSQATPIGCVIPYPRYEHHPMAAILSPTWN